LGNRLEKMPDAEGSAARAVLCGDGQRIQSRAAAEGFVKGGAEMAGTGVTDFHRYLRDIQFAGPQKLGGFLHAQIAKILRNGFPHLLRKNPAEIK
jgi:hypothetical protein